MGLFSRKPKQPLISLRDNASINIQIDGSELSVTANNIRKAKNANLLGPKAKAALAPPNGLESLLLEDQRREPVRIHPDNGRGFMPTITDGMPFYQ